MYEYITDPPLDGRAVGTQQGLQKGNRERVWVGLQVWQGINWGVEKRVGGACWLSLGGGTQDKDRAFPDRCHLRQALYPWTMVRMRGFPCEMRNGTSR